MRKYYLYCLLVLLTAYIPGGVIAMPSVLDESKAKAGKTFIDQIISNSADLDMLKKIYGDRVKPEDIVDVMAAYKQALASPSRFDDYLQGNKNALTEAEKQGYALFKSYGCAACHNGANAGGSQFKKMGVAKNYYLERKTLITPADLGLYEVTKNTKDVNVFKVPSLRNVVIMAPYYHDGSVKTLQEAIYLMGKYQVGVTIPDKDIQSIMIFLNALTAKPIEAIMAPK